MRLHPLAAWLVALLAAALLVAGCGDEDARDESKRDAPARTDEDDEPAGDTAKPAAEQIKAEEFRITIADGLVKGGPKSLRVDKGAHVRITITSDAKDEVHLHGIDIEAPVGSGRPGILEFDARDQGSYELELHEAGTVLGAVVVS